MRTLIRPIATLQKTTHELKHKYSCVGIKTSFEDEGVSPRDVVKLRTLTASHNLELCIKVGGCEARTDMQMANDLCADSIVGPMIESRYAAEKYAKSSIVFSELRKGLNIETVNAIHNIDSILSVQGLDYFVIGRVDLSGSMNQNRDYIESTENQILIENTLRKIKSAGKMTYLGGAIGKLTKPFVLKMYNDGLLDYIETRYVIIHLNHKFFDVWDDAIRTSHEFELKWLEYLAEKNSTTGLQHRIQLMKSRVHRSFSIDNTVLSWNPCDITLDSITVNAQPNPYTVIFTDLEPSFSQDDFVIIDDRLIGRYLNGHLKYYGVDAKELYKNIDTAMKIISHIETLGVIRRIVVIGGGITQDIGAFVSSVYKRGIEWVYWPTTLLAMADSCIGGKSSLNYRYIKNKIGTFCNPNTVFINKCFLTTLTPECIESGRGEILKLCMIGGALDVYEQNITNLVTLIKVSLIIKKSVIEIDQYDKGIRRALNYGHTIGHALEVMSGYTIPHGIAVSKGMVIENKLFGFSDPQLSRLVLDPDAYVDSSDVSNILRNDKKYSNSTLQFIIPVAPGKFESRFIPVDDVLCTKIKNIIDE